MNPVMETTDSILSVRDILRVLFKRKELVLSVTLVALVTCAVVVFLIPPTYESTAQILVIRSMPETEEPTLSQEPRSAPTLMRQVNQADEMNTAISILRSRDLVVWVMDNKGLTREQFDHVPDFRRYVRAAYNWFRETIAILWSELKYFFHLGKRPTPEEAALLKRERFVNDVVNALVVEQVTDSDVLRVGLRCSDPTLAKNFSNWLTEMALSWHIEKLRQPGNLAFFKEQAENAATRMEQIEKMLALTRNDLNLIGIEERKKLIIENRFQSHARLNDIRARLASGEAGVKKVERMLAEEPPMMTLSKETATNPLRQQISERLTELELKRTEAMGHLSKEGRVVKDMDTTLQEWRSQMEKVDPKRENSVVEGVNNAHQALRQKWMSLNTERAALLAEAKIVQQHINEYDQDLKAINERAYQVQDLERQQRTQGSVYEQYLKSAELARVAEAKQSARLANHNILQTAPLPVSPVKPRKGLNILLAGAGGFLFAVAWAFAAEMNDNTLGGETDLKKYLDGQVLGTLMECRAEDLLLYAPLIIPVGRRGGISSALARRGTRPPARPPRPGLLREDAQSICKRLFHLWGRNGSVIAGFASCRRGEGTTTVMLQTALAAAENGKSVILIDGEPEGGLTRLFGLEGRLGLADMAPGDSTDSIIFKTEIPNLSLVPAGKIELRGVPEADWRTWLMELRNHADIVFLDLPPILAHTCDPSVLSSVDGIVLVVSAHETRGEVLRRALDELARYEGVKLFGGVLNKRKYFIPDFLYKKV